MTRFETEGDGLFDALPVLDEETNARLHARLATAAQQAGVLDVAYRTIDTPVGKLLLAATGEGLVRGRVAEHHVADRQDGKLDGGVGFRPRGRHLQADR